MSIARVEAILAGETDLADVCFCWKCGERIGRKPWGAPCPNCHATNYLSGGKSFGHVAPTKPRRRR